MKKVIIEKSNSDTVYLSEVDQYGPVFAKKNGKLCGMIVKETKGWILRLGGESGSTGFHSTFINCAKDAIKYDHELFVN